MKIEGLPVRCWWKWENHGRFEGQFTPSPYVGSLRARDQERDANPPRQAVVSLWFPGGCL